MTIFESFKCTFCSGSQYFTEQIEMEQKSSVTVFHRMEPVPTIILMYMSGLQYCLVP